MQPEFSESFHSSARHETSVLPMLSSPSLSSQSHDVWIEDDSFRTNADNILVLHCAIHFSIQSAIFN